MCRKFPKLWIGLETLYLPSQCKIPPTTESIANFLFKITWEPSTLRVNDTIAGSNTGLGN